MTLRDFLCVSVLPLALAALSCGDSRPATDDPEGVPDPSFVEL